MDVKYILASPTQNITAIVESFVPIDRQAEVGAKIMEAEPACEQVAFLLKDIEGADIHFRMAGGEFCGNATMAVAAFYCKKNEITKKKVLVKVEGTKNTVEVDIEKEGSNYTGSVSMPRPFSIKKEKFVFETHNYWYPVVTFEGISHVIIEDELPLYMPEACIKMWCDTLHAQGLGMMLLSQDQKSIRPLVYVKNPESKVWESSCASGTTAVGAYFAYKEGRDINMSFKEPGGILTVEASTDGKLLLKGTVEFF